MDTFKFVFLLLSLSASILADSSEESSEVAKLQILSKLEERFPSLNIRNPQVLDFLEQGSKQMEKACAGSTEKLSNGLVTVIECVQQGENDTVCTRMKNQFKTCSAPILKIVEDCLPEKIHKLPTLFVDSFVSVFAYTCTLTGEETHEILNSCLIEKADTLVLDECKELKETLKNKPKEMKSPTEVCNTISEARPCVEALIKNSCFNEVTRKVFNGIFNAGLAPCNDLK